MNLSTQPFWQKNKKPRKTPKTKFEKQVNRLDHNFSLFIRLSAMDKNGDCLCISCGKMRPWNKHMTHAGHFIGRSRNTLRTRWDLQNVHPQCFVCNSILEGNKYDYGKALIKKYGEGIVEKLQIQSTKPFNPDIFDMEGKIKYYREEVKRLKKEKGIVDPPKKKKTPTPPD